MRHHGGFEDEWGDASDAAEGEVDGRDTGRYDDGEGDDDYGDPSDVPPPREPYDPDDDGYTLAREPGLVLGREQSLVNVSSTVTQHGVPLLSYASTMSRFYTNRKQRLSLGRYQCEVCGERIRFWAWETPAGSHTHDGCYERLAWMWTNLYAQQQRLANEGRLD